jgi:hypothetical protein
MKLLLICAMLALTACTTTQVTPVRNYESGTHSTGHVDVLYTVPNRPYRTVAFVSAKKYKPGWSDPTVSDAIPEMQAAGMGVGADAVIVRSHSAQDGRRIIVVECEAIKYTD